VNILLQRMHRLAILMITRCDTAAVSTRLNYVTDTDLSDVRFACSVFI
jgi:hypothetical protein